MEIKLIKNFIIRNLFDKKFIRFLLVGLINTIFGYSVYAFFLYIGFHYSLATLLSTILGIGFNFKTIGKLVFNSNNNRLILKFMAVYLFLYLINVLSLKLLYLFKLNLYLAGGILLLPMAVISFILNRKYVFNT